MAGRGDCGAAFSGCLRVKVPAHTYGGGEAAGIKQSELFEPLPFSPFFPSPSSMLGKALSMLLEQREGITTPDFQAITKSWRLSAYVHQLIHEYGWPVISLEIPFVDDPSRSISRYMMPEWVTKEVGVARG
jgi:hypothetical protein